MARERDLFVAIVIGGLALGGCGSATSPADEDAGRLADAGETMDAAADAGPIEDAGLEDAGEDAMVLIL